MQLSGWRRKFRFFSVWRRKPHGAHTCVYLVTMSPSKRHALYRSRHKAREGNARMSKHVLDEADTVRHAAARLDDRLVPSSARCGLYTV